MKLERMEDFFAARVDGYDDHMRATIEGASDFYAYTAEHGFWILAAEPDWSWKNTSGAIPSRMSQESIFRKQC